jgi:hypothetical protein
LGDSTVKIDFSSRDLTDATVTVKTEVATPILKPIDSFKDNSASTTQLTLPFDALNHIKDRRLHSKGLKKVSTINRSIKTVDAFCNAKKS